MTIYIGGNTAAIVGTDNAILAQDVKSHARVATTANGTLATAFANGQTVDGVVIATGDRVLLKDQSTGAENGLYTVNAAGAPTRATDWETGDTAAGFRCIATEGTANADTGFLVTNNDGSDVVGTDALVFIQYTSSGGAAMAHAMGGASHTADTLANLNTKISDGTVVDTGDARFSDARTPTAHDFAGAEHNADTLADVNSKISDATLIDTADARLSDARTPTAHDLGGAEHNADTLANLNSKISDGTVVDTGDARFSDARTPTAHDLGGAEHNADTLANLNSKISDGTVVDTGDARFSDARTPTAHDLGGAEHNADTLANLNSKISDGTVVDTGDARFSDARTPTAHALGGAEHSADTLANLNTKISDGTVVDTADARFSDDRVSPIFTSFGSGYTTAAPAAGGGTISENIDTGDISGIGVNGIIVSKIQITPSLDCDDYTVEFFRVDTHTGEVDFALTNVTTSAAAAVAELVKQEMTFVDGDASSELHIKITNDDAVTTPTFLIEIEGTTRS